MIKTIVTAVLSIGLTIGGMIVAMPHFAPVLNGVFGSFDLTQNPAQKNEITLSWTVVGPTNNLKFHIYRGAEKIAELEGTETSYVHTESVYGIVRYTVAAFSKDKGDFLEEVYGLAYTGRLTWDPPTRLVSVFTEHSANIWKASQIAYIPGTVYFDGVEGNKEAALIDLDAEYDWYHDDVENDIYVYSVGDPAIIYMNPGIEYTYHDGFYVYLAEGPGDPYQLLPYGDPSLFSYDAGDVTEVSLSELHSLALLEGGKEYYFAASTYLIINKGLPEEETLISSLTDPVYLVEYSIIVAEPVYPPAPPKNFGLGF